MSTRAASISGVARFDRYVHLCDDGPAVIFLSHKMYRHPGLLLPIGDDGFVDMDAVHPFPPVLRQECRMNVKDPARKMGQRFRPQFLHIAGQRDNINITGEQCIKDRPIEAIGVGMCLAA